MFLNGNRKIKQEKKNAFFNVHLRKPPFSEGPKGLKDPSVPGPRKI